MFWVARGCNLHLHGIECLLAEPLRELFQRFLQPPLFLCEYFTLLYDILWIVRESLKQPAFFRILVQLLHPIWVEDLSQFE
jgi:hypothetical protein